MDAVEGIKDAQQRRRWRGGRWIFVLFGRPFLERNGWKKKVRKAAKHQL